MNNTLIQLTERREQLISQAHTQRVELAKNIDPLRKPVAHLDTALNALRFIRKHYVLFALGWGILTTMQPKRRIWNWVRLGWTWITSRRDHNK